MFVFFADQVLKGVSPGIQIILVVVLANHRVLINICFISLHRIWYVGFHSKNAEQNQVVHGQQWCGVCSPRVRASLVNQCRTLSMAQWVGQGVLPGFQPWVSIPPGGGGLQSLPALQFFARNMKYVGWKEATGLSHRLPRLQSLQTRSQSRSGDQNCSPTTVSRNCLG